MNEALQAIIDALKEQIATLIAAQNAANTAAPELAFAQSEITRLNGEIAARDHTISSLTSGETIRTDMAVTAARNAALAESQAALNALQAEFNAYKSLNIEQANQ